MWTGCARTGPARVSSSALRGGAARGWAAALVVFVDLGREEACTNPTIHTSAALTTSTTTAPASTPARSAD